MHKVPWEANKTKVLPMPNGKKVTNLSTQILTLFSLTSPKLGTILDNVFNGLYEPSYGRFYFVGFYNKFIFIWSSQF